MTELLFRGDYGAAPTNVPLMLLSLLLAFLCGHLVAYVYMLTHSGLSYSRAFVNSLIVLPTVVAMVMMTLSNSLVTVFGLMAIFGIVRYRTVLRDTLDTTYVLVVAVLGMASGVMKFATAVTGTVVFCCIMLYLFWSKFGSRHRYDMVLNVHWGRPITELDHLRNLLTRHSLRALCASQRSNEGYQGTDLSFRLLLRDPTRMDDLLLELRALPGVSRVTGIKAEEESEI